MQGTFIQLTLDRNKAHISLLPGVRYPETHEIVYDVNRILTKMRAMHLIPPGKVLKMRLLDNIPFHANIVLLNHLRHLYDVIALLDEETIEYIVIHSSDDNYNVGDIIVENPQPQRRKSRAAV